MATGLAFVNENGIIINNPDVRLPYTVNNEQEKASFVMSLPTVGVDSSSWTYVYALSNYEYVDFTIDESLTDKYYFVDNKKEPDVVKSIKSKGFKLNSPVSGFEYMHIITLACNVIFNDTDNMLPTYSVSCCVNAYATDEYNHSVFLNNVVFITEFVEKHTSEILVHNNISKNIDRFLVNAVNNHDADAVNPDILLYNRKLKELLMNYNIAGEGTYQQLFNILNLFGFDNIQVYDVLKYTLKDSTYLYKETDPLYCDTPYLLDEYIKTYNIFVAFKCWEYTMLRGTRLTQSEYVEFESDKMILPITSTKQQLARTDKNDHDWFNDNGFEMVNIYPNSLETPYNDVFKSDDTNILKTKISSIEGTETAENDYISAIDKNKYRNEKPLEPSDVNSGKSKLETSDSVDTQTIKLQSVENLEGVELELLNGFSVIGDKNTTELDGFERATIYKPIEDGVSANHFKTPEVVPMINRRFDTDDATTTITRDELQLKTRQIKNIINNNFSNIYNNIFSCSIQDATYADNIKEHIGSTNMCPDNYNDIGNADNVYQNFLNNSPASMFVVGIEPEYADMPLIQYLKTFNKYKLTTGLLEPYSINPNLYRKPNYFLEDYHNTISNCQSTNCTSVNMPLDKAWRYYGTYGDVKYLNFKELYKINQDIKYIETFVVKTVYDDLVDTSKPEIHKLIERIKTNAKLKGYNADHQYSYSLHTIDDSDCNDFVLMKDASNYNVYIRFYNNLTEAPICELVYNNIVTSDKVSTPAIYELTYNKYARNCGSCDIHSIFHNDNYINRYPTYNAEEDVMNYYSGQLSNEFTNILYTTKLHEFQFNQYNISINDDQVSVSDDTTEIYKFKLLKEYYDNEELFNITKELNKALVEYDPTTSVCIDIHINSTYTAQDVPYEQIYTPNDIYVSLHDVRPNTNVELFLDYQNYQLFEQRIFYPRTWKKVNRPIKSSDMKYNKLYLIENKEGDYTNTDNTYTILDENNTIKLTLPTSGMIYHRQNGVNENIIVNYYDNYDKSIIKI